jgi:short-subunit dehydrogenase
MLQPFAGKSVLVTGASMGLGRALAVEFARSGADVVVAARSRDRLGAVAGEIGGLGRRAVVAVTDLAERHEIARAVETAVAAFGRLDVLVNNAGYGVSAFLEEVPPVELEKLFRVNVFALVDAVQLALPALTSSRGIVVNVGSVVGRRSVPPIGAYCMTKAAVASFSESLRAEVARLGVHVLHAEPGMTATHFSDNRRVFGAYQHPRTYRSGFVMPAEVAARKIVRATARRRDRIVLGLPGRMMILANMVAPWLVNRVLERYVVRNYGEAAGGTA